MKKGSTPQQTVTQKKKSANSGGKAGLGASGYSFLTLATASLKAGTLTQTSKRLPNRKAFTMATWEAESV